MVYSETNIMHEQQNHIMQSVSLSSGMKMLCVLTKNGNNFESVTTFENESSWVRSSNGKSKQLNKRL